MLNLNLGSGSKRVKNYINVDKYEIFKPDIIHNLEKFPYPFDDNSVDNIILSHILEHLGQNPNTFNLIIKELYRICKNSSLLDITVPHPRNDDFLADPTHVRSITVQGLRLYDKELNQKWQKQNAANTPLALIYNVNFKVKKVRYDLEKKYFDMMNDKKISKPELNKMIDKYNNVVKQIFIQLEVIK
tara:strand:+ start:303 stop:863 length:561 start_codon:yes stop_codon:yes gene_type:complete